jgi:hypothetical protein
MRLLKSCAGREQRRESAQPLTKHDPAELRLFFSFLSISLV